MLEDGGLEIEAIQGDYAEAEAAAEHDTIVFVTRKQS